MRQYYIGRISTYKPQFVVYSERPFIVWLTTTTMEIGNRTQGNFEIRSFESLKEAERYAKKNHDPDKAPTEAKVYAYAVGEWLPVMWKAI